MNDESMRRDIRLALRRAFHLAIVLALLGAVGASLAGCGSDTKGIVHKAVGSWGVSTQSGDVMRAIVLRDDGTYLILDSAGIGVRETQGRYVVVDASTLRTVDPVGPAGTMEFTVTGDTLGVVYGDSGASGYERMTEP